MVSVNSKGQGKAEQIVKFSLLIIDKSIYYERFSFPFPGVLFMAAYVR
jgi:hypothetical protein